MHQYLHSSVLIHSKDPTEKTRHNNRKYQNETLTLIPIPQIQELVNFVTAFVPSDTACLANSPGNTSLTAVCISREVIVGFLLYLASLDDSWASFSNISLMKLFMIPMALLEIPMSGWTCFSTLKM
ncbi:hypothetical protein RHGRI_036408 [Rhododendron griersonianum]|uniref:Uncharacterized protein n=1 Tax=Rhododendron griersonianum TaxID=479676 RepID=A0AAV6HNN5_9ERIC|nr:hypothetical protein RHGRI_036408 [Rhododendron griersonianum]